MMLWQGDGISDHAAEGLVDDSQSVGDELVFRPIGRSIQIDDAVPAQLRGRLHSTGHNDSGRRPHALGAVPGWTREELYVRGRAR